MSDKQIGASIDSTAREPNDIASWLPVIFLFSERHMSDIGTLGTAVK
jgi:hypothetical protein